MYVTYYMNSDALGSTYYVNNRENHHQGDLNTNAPQISNVLKDLKTVAIAKWRAEILIPCVMQSGILEDGYTLVMMFEQQNTFSRRKAALVMCLTIQHMLLCCKKL